MTRLRILHVVEASFAGVGRHVLDLAEACTDAGDLVDVAYGTARASAEFVDRLARCSVRHVATLKGGREPRPTDAADLRALAALVRDQGPYDIIHGHAGKGGALARLAPAHGAARFYTPNALITQSPVLSPGRRAMYSSIERRLARRTDGLVYVSSEEAAHGRSIGLRPRQDRVIPNGIDAVDLPSRDEARRSLGLDPEAPVIGFVGRLEEQKGIDRLIDAFALLSRTRPGARLAVVGDGDLASRCRDAVEALGVAERVHWLGRRHGATAMPAFDVLAVPSRYEGFPYVVLESLRAGVRVVATDSCGVATLLGDGLGGRVVPGVEMSVVADLAAALGAELGVADADRPARRIAAQEVVAPYTLAAMARETRGFYQEVLSRAPVMA